MSVSRTRLPWGPFAASRLAATDALTAPAAVTGRIPEPPGPPAVDPSPRGRRRRPAEVWLGRAQRGSRGRTPLLVVALALVAGGACNHVDPHAFAPVDDGRPGRPTIEAAPLQEWPLAEHADFDALEDALQARGGLSRLVPVYAALAAERPGDLRLRARHVLLLLRAGGQGRVQAAIPAVEALRAEAPEHPDVLFALGAIKRVVLYDRTSGTFFVGPDQRDIAQRLLEDWQRLLELAPDFRGPQSEDADALRRQVTALQRALAGTPADPGAAALGAADAPPGSAEAMAAVLHFMEARERLSPERGCIAGRAALQRGGADALPDLPGLVDEVCARTRR